MIYFFQGHERWAAGFGNPNVGAAVLLAWLFLLLAVQMRLVSNGRGHVRQTLFWLAGLFSVFFMIGIAATYSRGGIVAVIAVFASMELQEWLTCRLQAKRMDNESGAQTDRQFRLAHWWMRMLPAVFLLVVLLTPGGGNRLASIGGVRSDLSIVHRLYLWRGGCILIAQNWQDGVGPSPGVIYAKWLQPLEKSENYNGLISNALTIGASYGAWAMGLYFFLCFAGIVAGWVLFVRSGRRHYLWLGGVFMGIFVAGLFNTVWFLPELKIAAAMAGIWLATGLLVHRKGIGKVLAVWMSASLAASMALCLCIVAYGKFCEGNLPWAIDGSEKIPVVTTGFARLEAAPRNRGRAICHALVVTDDIDALVRPLILPLAADGVHVTAIKTDGGIQEIVPLAEEMAAWMKQLADDEETPSVVIADSENTSNTTCAALAELAEGGHYPDEALLFDLLENHPFPELSPDNLPLPRAPVILVGNTLQEKSSFAREFLKRMGKKREN